MVEPSTKHGIFGKLGPTTADVAVDKVNLLAPKGDIKSTSGGNKQAPEAVSPVSAASASLELKFALYA